MQNKREKGQPRRSDTQGRSSEAEATDEELGEEVVAENVGSYVSGRSASRS